MKRNEANIEKKKKGETCCSKRNRDNYKYPYRSSYLSKGEIEAGKTHFEKQDFFEASKKNSLPLKVIRVLVLFVVRCIEAVT